MGRMRGASLEVKTQKHPKEEGGKGQRAERERMKASKGMKGKTLWSCGVFRVRI